MYVFSLAYRYLMNRWISYLAILAVAVAVAANIIVSSVMNGFLTEIERAIKGVHGDLIVQSQMNIYNVDERAGRCRDVPGVAGAAPYIECISLGYIEFNLDGGGISTMQKPSKIKGVNWRDEVTVNEMLSYITAAEMAGGLPDVSPKTAPASKTPDKEYPGILVGESYCIQRDEAARKDVNLLKIGDLVTVYTVPLGDTKPLHKTFRVAGFYKSRLWDMDSAFVIMDLEWAQRMRKMEGSVDGIAVRIDGTVDRETVRAGLKRANPGCTVLTWEEADSVTYGNALFQKRMMAFILFIVLFVTAFMTTAILTMMVYQKFKEIGILQSMGATTRGIALIFLLQGGLIGLFGLLAGGLAGGVLAAYVDPICETIESFTGYEVFPTDVYYLDKVPSVADMTALAVIILLTLGISTLAALLPSLRAAWLDPARALRYE